MLVRVSKVLERRCVKARWLTFKDYSLKAQTQPIPTSSKSGKNARRSAWMTKTHTQKESIPKVEAETGNLADTVRARRDEVTKAKPSYN